MYKSGRRIYHPYFHIEENIFLNYQLGHIHYFLDETKKIDLLLRNEEEQEKTRL